MSVARTTFPAYSRLKMESPVQPAISGSRTGAEAAIASEADIRKGLTENFARLWRYGLVLSRQRDVADDLVQQTCVRALERAAQFEPGTRLDRWLFSIQHSIWLNEVRSRKVRQGRGFADPEEALVFDGARTRDGKPGAAAAQKAANRAAAVPSSRSSLLTDARRRDRASSYSPSLIRVPMKRTTIGETAPKEKLFEPSSDCIHGGDGLTALRNAFSAATTSS